MGLLIFNNLRHSEKDNTFNPYSQIYNYLLNNDTMNKYEFYILTTYYTDINKQNKILNQYHSGDISDSDITIKQNINDWNYLTPLLEQLSIITKNNDRTISLTDIAKKRVKNV